MRVVYFMHNLISISSSSSFPNSIICNPVCFDEKYFIFFLLVSGLVGVIVLFLLDCSPLIIRVLIVSIILRPLFIIKQIVLATILRYFFCGFNLNFPNQLEKLPWIDSKPPNELEKLPWINPNLSLTITLLTSKP